MGELERQNSVCLEKVKGVIGKPFTEWTADDWEGLRNNWAPSLEDEHDSQEPSESYEETDLG